MATIANSLLFCAILLIGLAIDSSNGQGGTSVCYIAYNGTQVCVTTPFCGTFINLFSIFFLNLQTSTAHRWPTVITAFYATPTIINVRRIRRQLSTVLPVCISTAVLAIALRNQFAMKPVCCRLREIRISSKTRAGITNFAQNMYRKFKFLQKYVQKILIS